MPSWRDEFETIDSEIRALGGIVRFAPRSFDFVRLSVPTVGSSIARDRNQELEEQQQEHEDTVLAREKELETRLIDLAQRLPISAPPSVHEAFKGVLGLPRSQGVPPVARRPGDLAFAATLLRARLAPYLQDTDPIYASKVELAILHLQRQLEADTVGVRDIWKSTFLNCTERELEKLGAIHLLSHGIYAFKASSSGGRTDLVCGEPPDPLGLERASIPQVLTEWKKVTGSTSQECASDSERKIVEGYRQLSLYERGVLGGLELHSTCFLVLVSYPNLVMPHDQELPSGRLVRHVNIVVDPRQPSNALKPLS